MSDAAEEPVTAALLDRLAGGDRAALDELLALHRPNMRGLVDRRMDGRLRARVDPSDVIQEAQMEVARRIDDYLARRPMPFKLWVIKTAHEHLIRNRRKHLDADCRAAGREQGLPDHSTQMLAGFLAGRGPTPSHAMRQAELNDEIHRALESLEESDREVLLLRVFEGLENAEVAVILGIEPDAASKRYGRALIRLRRAVAPG